MGVEYWLLDKHNKTFYDLGKGGWYAFNDDLEVFQDLECLTTYILEDIYNIFLLQVYALKEEEQNKTTIEYIKKYLAPDLYNLFKDVKPENLCVVNDCGDDMIICKSKKYKCIGTRFYFDDLEKRKQEIKYNNKHLEDTELNKRWYNSENYKQYPEWGKY